MIILTRLINRITGYIQFMKYRAKCKNPKIKFIRRQLTIETNFVGIREQDTLFLEARFENWLDCKSSVQRIANNFSQFNYYTC